MDHSNAEAVGMRFDSTVQQLRSLVVELCEALSCALGAERDSAEGSLSRATALLRTVEPAGSSVPHAPKGALAPWQVRKVTAYIESNLDRSLRSSELAELVSLSAAHFSRTFRTTFGCTPLEYVSRRRMERAQTLMLTTDTPLSQIALDCGLADQAHFSRLFRKVVGESPRVWRRAHASSAT